MLDVHDAPISKNKLYKVIDKIFLTYWCNCWRNSAVVTGKGLHLIEIRSDLKFWPWAFHKDRTIETVFAKLRIGHVSLNKHLYRFYLNTTPLCVCGRPESIEHIFLFCPIHFRHRTRLYERISPLHVRMQLKDLLGGGDYSADIQRIIIDEVALYLKNIGKLYYI